MDAHATLSALTRLSQLRAQILREAELSPAERCAIADIATTHDLETIYGAVRLRAPGETPS